MAVDILDQKALCVITNIVTKHYDCIMTHYKCPHNAHRCGLHRKCFHFIKPLLTAYRGYRKAVSQGAECLFISSHVFRCSHLSFSQTLLRVKND